MKNELSKTCSNIEVRDVTREIAKLLKLPKYTRRATIILDSSAPDKIKVNLDIVIKDYSGGIVGNIPYDLSKIDTQTSN